MNYTISSKRSHESRLRKAGERRRDHAGSHEAVLYVDATCGAHIGHSVRHRFELPHGAVVHSAGVGKAVYPRDLCVARAESEVDL